MYLAIDKPYVVSVTPFPHSQGGLKLRRLRVRITDEWRQRIAIKPFFATPS